MMEDRYDFEIDKMCWRSGLRAVGCLLDGQGREKQRSQFVVRLVAWKTQKCTDCMHLGRNEHIDVPNVLDCVCGNTARGRLLLARVWGLKIDAARTRGEEATTAAIKAP